MDLNKEMDQLEKMMEVVRAKYLMYFTGRDQVEPLQYRWQLEAVVRRMQKESFTNRMQANRFRSILQKLGNYQSLWNRLRREKVKAQGKIVDKEIEDALKKEMEEAGLEGEGDAQDALESTAVEQSVVETGGERPGEVPQKPEPPVPSSQPPPEPAVEPAAAPPRDYRELFQKFLEARRMTGEPIHGLVFEGFQKKLRDQLALLQKKYPGREFDFKVVLKDGKASLKAEPRN